MLVTEMAKTITNILKLSPAQFVSNIRDQHRCSRLEQFYEPRTGNRFNVRIEPGLGKFLTDQDRDHKEHFEKID